MTIQAVSGSTRRDENGKMVKSSRRYELDGHVYRIIKDHTTNEYELFEVITQDERTKHVIIPIHECHAWGEGWRWSRAERELENYHARISRISEKFKTIAKSCGLNVVLVPEVKNG